MQFRSILVAFTALLARAAAQAKGPEATAMDLLPIADTDRNGKVTDLDPQGRLAFFGITSEAQFT